MLVRAKPGCARLLTVHPLSPRGIVWNNSSFGPPARSHHRARPATNPAAVPNTLKFRRRKEQSRTCVIGVRTGGRSPQRPRSDGCFPTRPRDAASRVAHLARKVGTSRLSRCARLPALQGAHDHPVPQGQARSARSPAAPANAVSPMHWVQRESVSIPRLRGRFPGHVVGAARWRPRDLHIPLPQLRL